MPPGRWRLSRQRVECIGGWSFLLLALGIFCLLPGTIMAGIYASRSDTRMRIVALVLFCVSVSLVLIGIAMCLFWCKNTESNKKRKAEETMEEIGKHGHSPADFMDTPLTVKDLEVEDVSSSFPGSVA